VNDLVAGPAKTRRIARHSAAAVAFALLAVLGPRAGAQTTQSPAPAAATALPHVTVSAATFEGLARRTVTVTEDDVKVTYGGVDLGAALAKYGAPAGASLHGPAAADYALVRASDGYRTVFALAELDPALTDKIVLLADRRNDAPLDAKTGPFRIVVPDEKHHLRWIRNVVTIDVISPP
jgi:hypothetical protein